MREKVVMNVATFVELLGYRLGAFTDAHANGIDRSFDDWMQQLIEEINEQQQRDYLPDSLGEEAE